MRRPIFLAFAFALLCFASTLSAQQQLPPGGEQPMGPPCPECPQAPWSIMTQPQDLIVYTATPYIEIRWCDEDGTLDGGTRSITVNGVDRTSSFSYESASGGSCTGHQMKSVSNSVTLPLGESLIWASICDDDDMCGNSLWQLERLAGPLPIVSLAPYSSDLQDYGRCAASCFAAVYAQSTIPYFSLDTPRNVTLVHNSDRVGNRPFIHADVTPGDPANIPAYYHMRVRYGSTDLEFLNDTNVLRFAPQSSNTVRLGGQLKPGQINGGATGSYLVTVIVGAEYSTGIVETAVATRLIVVNQGMLAAGWNVDGLQRAVVQSDGILIIDGDGSATWFLKSGSNYITPTGDFSKLTAITGGYRRAFADSTRTDFNTYGDMIRLSGPWAADTTTFFYDSLHRLTAIVDPTSTVSLPRQITLTYDANGLSSIQDPFGRSTSISVGASQRLTAITDPGGGSTTFTYDDSLRLWKVTNRVGVMAMRWTYDTLAPSNKVVQLRGAQFRNSSGSLVYPTTDLVPWQRRGVPYVATTGPASAFLASLLDSVRAEIWDPGNHVTRFTVNKFGQPVATTDAAGNVSLVSYTTSGLIDSVVDPLGVNAGFDYNASGLPTRAVTGGLTTNFRYAPAYGRVDSIWGDGIPGQRDSIGANGRLAWRRVGGVAPAYGMTYDNYGRVITGFDAEGHSIPRSWYNGANGNRSRDSMPDGGERLYYYDQYGRLTADSSVGSPKDSTVYDLLNRVRQVRRAGDSIVYSYDSLHLRQVTDPKGQVYSFLYNSAGRLIRRTDPLGRSDTLQYSTEGLFRKITNRRGQTITMAYDGLHRLISRSGGGITAANFDYSNDGRVISNWSANGRVRTYLTATERRVDSVITYIRTSTTDSLKFVHRYHYRSNGLLDSVSAGGPVYSFVTRRFGYHSTRLHLDSMWLGSSLTRFVRNNDGQRISIILPGQPDTISHDYLGGHNRVFTRSDVLLDSHHFDSLGRLNQHLMGTQMRQYAYDSRGRLSSASIVTNPDSVCAGESCYVPYDSIQGYGYDNVGNRTTTQASTWDAAQLWSHGGTYATGNRITAFAGCSYQTDSLTGEVRQRSCGGQTVNFVWTAAGQLDSIKVVGGDTTRFYYDAEGRLVRRTVNGTTTGLYVWEGDNLFAEVAANGNRIMEYSYYATDDLHAIIEGVGGSRYYAHNDRVGNVRGFTDESGWTTQEYEYDPFGQITGVYQPNALPSNRTKWKGALQMSSELDLYLMRNRWYEPYSGRFLSEDPLGIAGGINTYAFGKADPINAADPFGLGCERHSNNPESPSPDHPEGEHMWPNGCDTRWGEGLPPAALPPRDAGCIERPVPSYDRSGACFDHETFSGEDNRWRANEPISTPVFRALNRCKGEIAGLAVSLAFDYLTAGQGARIRQFGASAAKLGRQSAYLGRRGNARILDAVSYRAGLRGAEHDLALETLERGNVRGTSAALALQGEGLSLMAAGEMAASFVPMAGTVISGAKALRCLAGR